MNRWTFWTISLCVLAGTQGCAYLRSPAETGPPAETFRWNRPVPDEKVAAAETDSSETPSRAPATKPQRKPAAKPAEPEPVVVETTPPATATTPKEAEVDLSVELPAAEKAKLADGARTQIAEAQRVVDATLEDSLSPVGKETLGTIRELIGSANDALASGDVTAAESLARKAYLLAVELRSP